MIASLTQNVEQFADVVGFELVCVQQQNLFWLVADGLPGELLSIGKYLVAVREVACTSCSCSAVSPRFLASS